MNLKRMVIAGIGAWVVAFVYSLIVYGGLLRSEFARYPGVYRSMHQATANLPILLIGSAVSMFSAVYMYGKGYEGGNGVAEGARFGAILGLFLVGSAGLANYATLNIGGRLGLSVVVAGFVEMVLIGSVIGALYKPAVRAKTVRV